MSRYYQKETHGVRSQVLAKFALRFNDSPHNQKDLGPLCYHQSQGCHQANLKKCALPAGPESHGRQYD